MKLIYAPFLFSIAILFSATTAQAASGLPDDFDNLVPPVKAVVSQVPQVDSATSSVAPTFSRYVTDRVDIASLSNVPRTLLECLQKPPVYDDASGALEAMFSYLVMRAKTYLQVRNRPPVGAPLK